MKTARFLALAIAAGLGLLAGPCLAQAVLKMDAPTQNRLGVTVAPLQAARRTATIAGFARVIDPTPLATLDADIVTAASALAASQAEATRTRALNAADQTVSKRVAEAAQAQARADAAKLALLRRRVALEWGPSLGAYSDAARGRLISDIAAGRAALIRIDAAANLAQARGSVRLDLGDAGPVQATILGPARLADPRLQSAGLLAVARGGQAARLGAGMVAPVRIPGASAASGVVIPRAALLRTAGQTFAYIRKAPGAFERRPVTGGLSDPAGLFVATGFRAGESVVIAGAAQLFAAETPHAQVD